MGNFDGWWLSNLFCSNWCVYVHYLSKSGEVFATWLFWALIVPFLFFFFFTSGKIKLFIGKTFLFLNLYACVYHCGDVHVLIQGESLTGCPMQNQVENQLTLKYMECKVSHLTFWQPTMGRKVQLLHILILEADLLYCFCQHPHVGEYIVTTL